MLRWQRERQAAAHRRVELRRFVRPRIEILPDRILPSTDVLVWNNLGGDNKASNPANWWDEKQNKQGVTAPTNGNTIWLNPNFSYNGINRGSNAPITWDFLNSPPLPQNPAVLAVSDILLSNGYNAVQTIKDGITLQSALGMGVNDANSVININFAGTGSSFWQTGGNNVWQSFNLTSAVAQPDKFNGFAISGGSVTISSSFGLTQTSQVGIEVYSSAALNLGTTQTGALSTLTLQNGTGWIGAYGGTVNLFGTINSKQSATFVQGDGGGGKLAQGSEEIVAAASGSTRGTVSYQGTSSTVNSLQDYLWVPVWANGGNFFASGGGTFSTRYTNNGSKGSVLDILGSTQDSNNAGVYASGDANGNYGLVQLSGNVYLAANNGINIGNNGFLQTGDNTDINISSLIVGVGGTIQPWYGSPGGAWQFDVRTINGNFTMSGTYNAAVGYDIANNAVSVLVQVTGSETWFTGSSFIQPFQVSGSKTGPWTISTAQSITVNTPPINHSGGWSYNYNATSLWVWD